MPTVVFDAEDGAADTTEFVIIDDDEAVATGISKDGSRGGSG